MGVWFVIIISLCIAAILKSLCDFAFTPSTHKSNPINLPPGPRSFPVIGGILWVRRSFSEIESILRQLRVKYGPVLTLRIGSRPLIFVASHSFAHRALVQHGAVFSDRPKALPTSLLFNVNQRNVSSAAYGPIWRLFRRNLTAEILHPSRIKSYSHARKWVLEVLLRRLFGSSSASAQSKSSGVKVKDDFQYAMFCLLVYMCFGDRLEENQIKEIEKVQREMLLSVTRFRLLNLFPRLGKVIFRNRWRELIQLKKNQDDVLIPLMKARLNAIKEGRQSDWVVAYVDTLMNLELPDEKRSLSYEEMLSLCSEFLNAGTDTTSTCLEWLMANLVKYPAIQAKLYEEIVGVVGPPPALLKELENGEKKIGRVVTEEDLQRMSYLKAVVLEGLRRHPPSHFVLPHRVKQDVELDGFRIPKNASINFMVAEMGLDPNVWENPMEFKPERFLAATAAATATASHESGVDGGDGVDHYKNMSEMMDITGSREIKMMPFGAGRRICPGLSLALLHLEYFVANLVWYFEWNAVEGDEIDLSEKQEFTVVMKNPLQARISPRVK